MGGRFPSTAYDRWKLDSPEEHNPIVGYDWQGEVIHLTDNDDYIDIDGEWVLDEPSDIAEYIRYNYQIVNTYDMEEE